MAPQQETWVVTGASRGLGLEHVKQFLKQGFTIVAAARSPSKSEALAKLHKEYQDKLILVSLDTADCKSVKAGVMCQYMHTCSACSSFSPLLDPAGCRAAGQPAVPRWHW